MRLVSALSLGWERAWFAPSQPAALATFRIAFGSFWTVVLLLSFPNWLRFYGRDGIVPFAWLSDPFFARPSILSVSSAELWTWACYGFALAAAVAFTLGYRTRPATVALYLTVISMVNRTPTITHGEDLVSRPLLFLACFASLGERWSIDAFLRTRRGQPTRQPAEIWPLRLMQLTVVSVYLFSMPAKPSDDPAWIDGTAIYYVMASENWGRFPELAPLFYSGWLGPLLTWGTLAIEGLFCVLVWPSRTRPYALAALASLQLGIAVLVGHVFNFNLAMLISFLLFVPDQVLERIGERLRALRLRVAARAVVATDATSS